MSEAQAIQGNAPEDVQDYVPEPQEQPQEHVPAEELEQEFFDDPSRAQDQGVEEEDQKDQENWEHKYKVIKGKYDKEVPRLHKELRLLKEDRDRLLARVALLEQVLSSVQQSQQQAVGTGQPSTAPEVHREDEEDEDLKKIKEDFPDIYRAVLKLVEKKVSKDLLPEIYSIKTSTSQAQFYAKLSSLVPEWETLNTDPSFLAWLNERSAEIPTMTRHQIMMDAFNRGDATAVAGFFKRYLEEQQGGSQPEPQPQAKATQPPTTAPPHRKTSVSGKTTSKKVFTEDEIRDFYQKAALGKIPPEKKAELEQEIIQAVLEGRVVHRR